MFPAVQGGSALRTCLFTLCTIGRVAAKIFVFVILRNFREIFNLVFCEIFLEFREISQNTKSKFGRNFHNFAHSSITPHHSPPNQPPLITHSSSLTPHHSPFIIQPLSLTQVLKLKWICYTVLYWHGWLFCNTWFQKVNSSLCCQVDVSITAKYCIFN